MPGRNTPTAFGVSGGTDAAAANAAEFMGHISMKKPGRNPALAITRFNTFILPSMPANYGTEPA